MAAYKNCQLIWEDKLELHHAIVLSHILSSLTLYYHFHVIPAHIQLRGSKELPPVRRTLPQDALDALLQVPSHHCQLRGVGAGDEEVGLENEETRIWKREPA